MYQLREYVPTYKEIAIEFENFLKGASEVVKSFDSIKEFATKDNNEWFEINGERGSEFAKEIKTMNDIEFIRFYADWFNSPKNNHIFYLYFWVDKKTGEITSCSFDINPTGDEDDVSCYDSMNPSTTQSEYYEAIERECPRLKDFYGEQTEQHEDVYVGESLASIYNRLMN